jgi:hypothetical protein
MEVAADISGAKQFDYYDNPMVLAIDASALTSHDLIEANIDLTALCTERGFSWTDFSERYDAIIALHRQI